LLSEGVIPLLSEAIVGRCLEHKLLFWLAIPA
jgi:hypothetical protein